MGLSELIRYEEERNLWNNNKIPSWIREEHLEMNTPLNEIYKCNIKAEKKSGRTAKTIVAMLVFFLFLFAQGAIVVTGCLESNIAVLARAGIMLLLDIGTVVYYLIRYKNIKILGFRKNTPGSAKRLLLYIPLLVISLLYFATGLNSGEGTYFVLTNGVLILAMGAAEEIYFRGIICSVWKEKSMIKAMLVSSILFGVCHMMNVLGGADVTITIMQICFAFVYGMVFAILYLTGKNLIPCILLHVFHNLCCYLSVGGTIRFSIVLAVIQTAILISYFIYLFRYIVRREDNRDNNE